MVARPLPGLPPALPGRNTALRGRIAACCKSNSGRVCNRSRIMHQARISSSARQRRSHTRTAAIQTRWTTAADDAFITFIERLGRSSSMRTSISRSYRRELNEGLVGSSLQQPPPSPGAQSSHPDRRREQERCPIYRHALRRNAHPPASQARHRRPAPCGEEIPPSVSCPSLAAASPSDFRPEDRLPVAAPDLIAVLVDGVQAFEGLARTRRAGPSRGRENRRRPRDLAPVL
jgi:hypothetical protein